jgi:hypothetical protein
LFTRLSCGSTWFSINGDMKLLTAHNILSWCGFCSRKTNEDFAHWAAKSSTMSSMAATPFSATVNRSQRCGFVMVLNLYTPRSIAFGPTSTEKPVPLHLAWESPQSHQSDQTKRDFTLARGMHEEPPSSSNLWPNKLHHWFTTTTKKASADGYIHRVIMLALTVIYAELSGSRWPDN